MEAKHLHIKSKVIDLQNHKLLERLNDRMELSPLVKMILYPFQRIKIFNKGMYVFIPVKNILFLKAESNYVRIVLNNRKQYLLSKTLKQVLLELESPYFYRCHHSFVVNIQFVELLNPNKNQIQIKDHLVPISRTKRKDFKEALFRITQFGIIS